MFEDLTRSTFYETLEEHERSIVIFHAPWCGPCKKFLEEVEEIAEKNEIPFFKVNSEKYASLAALHKITEVPTIAVFKKSFMKFAIKGFPPKEVTLDSVIQQILSLT